jgi:hypothetical protein
MSKKTFFILLAVLGVLYACSAGFGLLPDSGGDMGGDKDSRKASIKEKQSQGSFPPSVMAAMGNVLSRSIKPDDVVDVLVEPQGDNHASFDRSTGKLTIRGNGVNSSELVRCTLRFADSRLFRVQRLQIRIESGKAQITFPSTDDNGNSIQESQILDSSSGDAREISIAVRNGETVSIQSVVPSAASDTSGQAAVCELVIGTS